MKKEKVEDYSIAELVTIANISSEISDMDYEYEGTDKIVYEIAERAWKELNSTGEYDKLTAFHDGDLTTLENAIEIVEHYWEKN